MNMQWTLEWDPAAQRELRKLAPQARRRILDFLNDRVLQLDNPRQIGQPLTGTALGTYWKYRIGDYRAVVDIKDKVLRILIIRIGHRRDVYKN